MRKYIALVAAICCSVAMTGCGKDATSGGNTSSDTNSTSSVVTSAGSSSDSVASNSTGDSGSGIVSSLVTTGTVYNETSLSEAMAAESEKESGIPSVSDPYDYEGGCKAFDVNTTYENGIKSVTTIIYSGNTPDSLCMSIVLPAGSSYEGTTFGDLTKIDEHTLRSARNKEAVSQMPSFDSFDECYKFYVDMCSMFQQTGTTHIDAEYSGELNFDDATIYGPDGEIIYQPGDDSSSAGDMGSYTDSSSDTAGSYADSFGDASGTTGSYTDSSSDTAGTTQVGVIGDPVASMETTSVYDVTDVIDLQNYSMLINIGDTVLYPINSAPAGTLKFETNNVDAVGLKLGTDGKVYVVATAKGNATVTVTASNGKTGMVMVSVLS